MSKLTGKCKEAFEEWYLETVYTRVMDNETKTYYLRSFYNCRLESEKFGVYQDFFDSVGMIINIDKASGYKNFYWWYFVIEDKDGVHLNNHVKDRIEKNCRHTARTKAIEKANELYNENNESTRT